MASVSLTDSLQNATVLEHLQTIDTQIESMHFRPLSVYDLHSCDLKELNFLMNIFAGLYDLRNKREQTTYYSNPEEVKLLMTITKKYSHLFFHAGYQVDCIADEFYDNACTLKLKWNPKGYQPSDYHLDSNSFHTFRFPTVRDLNNTLVRTFMDFTMYVISIRINEPEAVTLSIDKWSDDLFKLAFFKYLKRPEYAYEFYQEADDSLRKGMMTCNFSKPEAFEDIIENPKQLKGLYEILHYMTTKGVFYYCTDVSFNDLDVSSEHSGFVSRKFEFGCDILSFRIDEKLFIIVSRPPLDPPANGNEQK